MSKKLLFVAALCSLCWVGRVEARPYYNKKQLKAFLHKSRASYTHRSLTKNSHLRALHHKMGRVMHRMRVGVCKRIGYPWVGKHCHRHCIMRAPTFRKHCKWGVCVKIPSGTRCVKRANVCFPYKETRHARVCLQRRGNRDVFLIDGRRTGLGAIEKFGRSEIAALKRDFGTLKRDAKRTEKVIAKTAKKVAKVASHVFDGVIAKLRREAKKIAHKLVPMFYKRMRGPIKKGLSKQSQIVLKTFLKKAPKAIRIALKSQKSIEETTQMLKKQRAESSELRSYTITVLASMAMIVGIESLEVTARCWFYGGSAKRACLRDAIADATRDGIFELSSMSLQLALDTFVIEPFSEELGGEVAVGLAAMTEGVGAVAYPIAYFASSVSLNVAVALLTEELRSTYNHFYEKTLAKKNQKWIDKLVRSLSPSAVRCVGPKQLCKHVYRSRRVSVAHR